MVITDGRQLLVSTWHRQFARVAVGHDPEGPIGDELTPTTIIGPTAARAMPAAGAAARLGGGHGNRRRRSARHRRNRCRCPSQSPAPTPPPTPLHAAHVQYPPDNVGPQGSDHHQSVPILANVLLVDDEPTHAMKQELIRAACRIPHRRHLLLQSAPGILLPQVGFRVEDFLPKRLRGLFRRLPDPKARTTVARSCRCAEFSGFGNGGAKTTGNGEGEGDGVLVQPRQCLPSKSFEWGVRNGCPPSVQRAQGCDVVAFG